MLASALYFQPWVSEALPVAMEVVEPAPVTRVLAVNGRIAAQHSVDVRSLVSGSLSHILVTDGQAVRAGGELARIDASTQQAVVRQAVAGLDAALVAQGQAAAALARAEALGANAPRVARDDAASAVETAAQEVARLTALVEQAQIQLGNFTIRAPMTGTVLALNVDPGQNVDPSTVLLTLADLSRLIVETNVDEAYATQIRVGMPAVLQLSGDTALHDGRVSFVSQRVDAGTGGLAMKLAFEEAVTAPVGLTVTANIIVDRRDAAITAPRAAIRTVGDRTTAFVIVDGVAETRSVKVIDWPAARLIVTEGLSPGDVLILDAADIVDRQSVRVVQP
ncbi:MAG: efflux RND transporter periplasmic adaptor subunit [Mesorhizobium sp.]|nr:efflux RND transporter periplasmic adaptor subunit [Mesorhizobium sp.]